MATRKSTVTTTVSEAASFDQLIASSDITTEEATTALEVDALPQETEGVEPEEATVYTGFYLDESLDADSVDYGKRIKLAIEAGEIANRPYIHNLGFLASLGLDVTEKISLVTLNTKGFTDALRTRNKDQFSFVANLAYLRIWSKDGKQPLFYIFAAQPEYNGTRFGLIVDNKELITADNTQTLVKKMFAHLINHINSQKQKAAAPSPKF